MWLVGVGHFFRDILFVVYAVIVDHRARRIAWIALLRRPWLMGVLAALALAWPVWWVASFTAGVIGDFSQWIVAESEKPPQPPPPMVMHVPEPPTPVPQATPPQAAPPVGTIDPTTFVEGFFSGPMLKIMMAFMITIMGVGMVIGHHPMGAIGMIILGMFLLFGSQFFVQAWFGG